MFDFDLEKADMDALDACDEGDRGAIGRYSILNLCFEKILPLC